MSEIDNILSNKLQWHIEAGDAFEVLRRLPDTCIQTCVTSPPYFGLRDYGIDGQIGHEETHELYISRLVEVFREVRRVLRKDGTLWLNLGDSYARKNLIGIPWRVAFALQTDGWFLRSDIIWCLSGGTWLYVRTQKGAMPMMVKDMARLDPTTVQLWNGEKWTQLLGTSKSERKGNELELLLRSGERISCTPTHKFPTKRGLLEASELVVGDVLDSTIIPEPEIPRDCAIDEDAAWLAGLYIAEGSMSGDTIQIAGHTKEEDRWEKVQKIARKYGGSATRTVKGNGMDIRMYGKILTALLSELVTGRVAKDKGFSPIVWRYSNKFIASMVDGYLSGDGYYDANNDRWRLGFTRNYNLERDLRTACARLGYHLTLKMSSVAYDGRKAPTFRGELRKVRSGHQNEKNMGEIVQIRNARCQFVYDIGVQDEPHVFSLASGILTHNSKPNAMPESVKDRPTRSHEYVFLFSKSKKYYYDYEAIQEDAVNGDPRPPRGSVGTRSKNNGRRKQDEVGKQTYTGFNERYFSKPSLLKRNKRDVWNVSTQPFPGVHFATFPPDLIDPCVLAGSPAGSVVLDPFCGSGTVGIAAIRLERKFLGVELNPQYVDMSIRRIYNDAPLLYQNEKSTADTIEANGKEVSP